MRYAIDIDQLYISAFSDCLKNIVESKVSHLSKVMDDTHSDGFVLGFTNLSAQEPISSQVSVGEVVFELLADRIEPRMRSNHVLLWGGVSIIGRHDERRAKLVEREVSG